jgi:hypothetical protein
MSCVMDDIGHGPCGDCNGCVESKKEILPARVKELEVRVKELEDVIKKVIGYPDSYVAPIQKGWLNQVLSKWKARGKPTGEG